MRVNIIKMGVIFLFVYFSYASPICKCWGSKGHEQEQNVLERFSAILERQGNSNLVKNVREFIDNISFDGSEDKTKLISKNKNIVKACFSVRLHSGSVFLIFSRYAENMEDFDWIVRRMEWCGGRSFVWREMSLLNTLNLSFFHTLSVMKNFGCVTFMFNMICKYAPTPRELRNFLLYKNESDECILTCISYSSVLSSDEKILFLRLFVNKIRENSVEIYSQDVGDRAELTLLTELNESLLFEVIRNALVVHRRLGDWVSPFIKELVKFVHSCGGVEAVKDFVNKIKVNSEGQSLTALDLLFIHNGLHISQVMMDDLIAFLHSVGAKRFQEL